jgi:deoxyribodipyrimidine photolyase
MSNQSEPPVRGLAAYIPADPTNSSSSSEQPPASSRALREFRRSLEEAQSELGVQRIDPEKFWGDLGERAVARKSAFYNLRYEEVERTIRKLQEDMAVPRFIGWNGTFPVKEPEVVPEEWGEVAP